MLTTTTKQQKAEHPTDSNGQRQQASNGSLQTAMGSDSKPAGRGKQHYYNDYATYFHDYADDS